MQRIAYFTAAERRLLGWSAGVLRAEARFSADDAGLAAWRDCLARHRGTRLTVVTDFDDEEFGEEYIPRLRGRDRAAVIERRLAQRFPNGRFVLASSLGSAPGGRERELLLLASLTDAGRLTPWLDALHECGVQLEGLTSTAWLVAPLLARHAGQGANGLVISLHAQGLRECFLQHGQLRFARFEPDAAGEDAHAVRRLRGELDRLLPYLAARRLLPDEAQVLPVTVIARAASHAAVEAVLPRNARYALRLAALESLAGEIGLRGAPSDLAAEQLFLALAARRRPRAQFTRGTDRRRLLQWRVRRALLALGASVCVAGAATAGFQWLQLQTLHDERRQYLLESRTAAQPPEVPQRREGERLAVDELRRLAAASAAPEAALVHLSRALEQSPRIELDALTWSVPASGAPGAAAAEPPAQTLEIRARIARHAQADVRALGTEIARFATALQSGSVWQVVRTQLPFDPTPQGTLRSGDGVATSFTIVIARPLG